MKTIEQIIERMSAGSAVCMPDGTTRFEDVHEPETKPEGDRIFLGKLGECTGTVYGTLKGNKDTVVGTHGGNDSCEPNGNVFVYGIPASGKTHCFVKQNIENAIEQGWSLFVIEVGNGLYETLKEKLVSHGYNLTHVTTENIEKETYREDSYYGFNSEKNAVFVAMHDYLVKDYVPGMVKSLFNGCKNYFGDVRTGVKKGEPHTTLLVLDDVIQGLIKKETTLSGIEAYDLKDDIQRVLACQCAFRVRVLVSSLIPFSLDESYAPWMSYFGTLAVINDKTSEVVIVNQGQYPFVVDEFSKDFGL